MTYKVQPQSIYDSGTDATQNMYSCSVELRLIRNRLLAQCDWTQAADSPLSDSKKAEWATYRQALRDLPASHASENDLTNVDFPDIPS